MRFRQNFKKFIPAQKIQYLMCGLFFLSLCLSLSACQKNEIEPSVKKQDRLQPEKY